MLISFAMEMSRVGGLVITFGVFKNTNAKAENRKYLITFAK